LLRRVENHLIGPPEPFEEGARRRRVSCDGANRARPVDGVEHALFGCVDGRDQISIRVGLVDQHSGRPGRQPS